MFTSVYLEMNLSHSLYHTVLRWTYPGLNKTLSDLIPERPSTSQDLNPCDVFCGIIWSNGHKNPLKIQELQLAFQSETELPSTDTFIKVCNPPNVLSLQVHLTEYVSGKRRFSHVRRNVCESFIAPLSLIKKIIPILKCHLIKKKSCVICGTDVESVPVTDFFLHQGYWRFCTSRLLNIHCYAFGYAGPSGRAV